MTELSDRDCKLLVALADGELHGWRRTRAEARVRELPDGERLLGRQRRARRALQGVEPVPAPARRSSWAPRLALIGAATLLLALVLAGLPGRGSLTSEAAELAHAPATGPAPPATGPVLQAAVEGVRFPNWGPEFGWRQTGARTDTLDGRATRTVFYEHMGHRIAYTILPGPPVTVPSDARVVRRGGLAIALVKDGERDIAIFERDGRTCVLAGHVERQSTLVKLAAWTGG